MASYPWLSFSAQTQERQREINTLALKIKRCPPVIEDGKLGPSTCGAAKVYSTASPAIADMLGSCQKYNDAAAVDCFKLPWAIKNDNTLTLQKNLNDILVAKGFCALTVDGILGPTTCAGAEQVVGRTVATSMGCQTYGALKTCGATNTPGAPLAPVPSVPPPTADTPSTISPAPSPAETTTPAPTGPSAAALAKKCTDNGGRVDGSQCVWSESNWCDLQAYYDNKCFPVDVTAPVDAKQKKSSSMWPWLLGAGILAVGAGTYVAMKKRKK